MYRNTCLFIACAFAAAMAYPCYVASAGPVDYLWGDASLWLQWQHTPKRIVIEQFLSAWKGALPYSAVIGLCLFVVSAAFHQALKSLWLPLVITGSLVVAGLTLWQMGVNWPVLASVVSGFILMATLSTGTFRLLVWRHA